METLPLEILILIIEHLPGIDRVCLTTTCRRLREAVYATEDWPIVFPRSGCLLPDWVARPRCVVRSVHARDLIIPRFVHRATHLDIRSSTDMWFSIGDLPELRSVHVGVGNSLVRCQAPIVSLSTGSSSPILEQLPASLRNLTVLRDGQLKFILLSECGLTTLKLTDIDCGSSVPPTVQTLSLTNSLIRSSPEARPSVRNFLFLHPSPWTQRGVLTEHVRSMPNLRVLAINLLPDVGATEFSDMMSALRVLIIPSYAIARGSFMDFLSELATLRPELRIVETEDVEGTFADESMDN